MKGAFTVILVLLASFSLAQVPIVVQERSGIARTAEPVTLGIPFAKGSLIPATPLRITNGGIPINAQFKTMAVWDDGSIRWLKCDFQATVSGNNSTQVQLESGTPFTPTTELTTSETASNITVTTGPLRFVVSKTNFNLFDQVWLDSNGDRVYSDAEKIISSGSTGPVVTASAVNYLASAQPPDLIEIEEAGPMKVVIKVSGKHFNGANQFLKYETRIYAFAGKSYVRLWHVYANGKSVDSLGSPLDPANGAAFAHYSIDLNLNLAGTKTVRFGGDNGAEFSMSLASGDSATLRQQDRNALSVPLAFSIQRNTATQATGARAEGWGDISDANRGLLVSSRYFWQKYPKGLVFRDDGHISIEPVPTPEFLYVGMGTGDEILLDFHTAAEAAQAGTFAMGFNKNPLTARTTPQQYASSKAFYALLAGPSAQYPQMNTYANEVTTNHLANENFLGNINFGAVPYYDFGLDPNNIDGSTWGGNYYDASVLTTARLFAETGDPRYADIFVRSARHFMETACWNTYDPNDWMNGYNPAYADYHRGTAHFEQHYGEGIWYYYYLTGDERAREIGLRAANSITFQQFWGNNNVNLRLAYQRGSAVLEAFKNTRDVTYLNHAHHLLVTKILDTMDSYGVVGSTDENNNIEGEQVFMMALYSDTLWKYIQEIPANDPERAELISKLARMADFFDRYARKSPGVEDYWNFFGPPPNSQPPTHVGDPNNPDSTVYWDGRALMAGTYAYAYDLTGDARYRALATNILANIWVVGSNGEGDGSYFWSKVSGQTMKNMIHAVAIIEGSQSGTNLPPTSNAGPDQIVTEGEMVTLQGSGSDPEGGNMSFAWTQLSGPVVVLSDTTAVSPTFTAPQVNQLTTLTFRLLVTDDGNLTAEDQVTITVQNVGQSVFFFDDFQDGDAGDWLIRKGNWTVTNEELSGSTGKKAEILSPDFGSCTVCTVHANLRFETVASRLTLLGWYRNSKNAVEITVMDDKNKIQLKQKSGGATVANQTVSLPISTATDFNLQVSFDGNNFVVILDGSTVLTVPAANSPNGNVGLRVKSPKKTNVTVRVKDILVD